MPSDKNFLQELAWRGLIHDSTPDLDAHLQKGMATAYIGFDPTAPSLHIGNLATIMLLVFWQRAGHRPIALMGGATGMIGDPSGKASERKLLDEDTIAQNLAGQEKQLRKFLNFDEGENAALLLNNHDWYKELGVIPFLRDVGKHITINYMLAKDSVKDRLEAGLSFTEFSYQLMQAYDFYHLYTQHQCKVQLGGSDQWGNLTTGTELIRKRAGGEAHALVGPLLLKADGAKFGKSEQGNVWLDASLTSPYKFYQFLLNSSDDDIEKLLLRFSLKPKDELLALIAQQKEAPHTRVAQNALAEELTERVHSAQDLEKALRASGVLFGKEAVSALQDFSVAEIEDVFDGVPQAELSKAALQQGLNILDALADGLVTKSKGEARRMLDAGSIRVNKEKVDDQEASLSPDDLLLGQFVLVQRGKKNYHLLRFV